MIVSLRPDLDALSDQDAPDAGGRAAAQNAEIIQAGTVAIAPGQLFGHDRDRDRRPWISFNHLPLSAIHRRSPFSVGDRQWIAVMV